MARAGKRMDNEAMESGLHCGTCGRVADVLLWTADRQWTCRSCQQAASAAVVATCTECGGKYRPAGGPCLHEHPALPVSHGYYATCDTCREAWQPGHTCLRQPTTKEAQDMREQAYWLRVMEDVLDHFGYETQVAAPASWEAV